MKLLTTLLTPTIISTVSAAEFYLLALRSASPIHFGEINAARGGLFIGEQPAVYCPDDTVDTCANVTTSAYVGGNGELSLDAVVPGGQAVYIDPSCGKVEYTMPHSAAMPVGAIVDGWTLDELPSYGLLSNSNGGVFFCNEDNSTVWQMYVDIDGVEIGEDCLGADLAAGNYTGPVPWEYLG